MNTPVDTALPFFAYGLFRPGQLAFLRIRDFVEKIWQNISVSGDLRMRDGLPILDPEGQGSTCGSIIRFLSGESDQAYERIAELEPGKQYRWSVLEIDAVRTNVLVGRSPGKGSVLYEYGEWNCWDDPLLTVALDVIEQVLAENEKSDWDLRPLFRLQMAYLLLWSSIERYLSLRYHLGKDVVRKIGFLASEAAFTEGLLVAVKKPRRVISTIDPADKVSLNRDHPAGSLKYYYQIRSNIVHRGKAVHQDHDLILMSLRELLAIFRGVLAAAQHDASQAI